MKRIKKLFGITFLILWIILFLIADINSQIYDAEALKLTIHLDKDSYLENEAIWVTVSLKNTSDKEVYAGILEPGFNYLKFYILTANGDTLPSSYVHGDFLSPDWKYPSLEPFGEDIEFINPLGPYIYFGINTEGWDGLWGSTISAGEYTIQAKLKDYYHKSVSERVDILSNKLTFKVITPTGVEKEVHDLLANAIIKKIKGNSFIARDIFEKIIKEYPQSVYVDNAFFNLPTTYFHNLELAHDFLTKYPNSGIVSEVIKKVSIRVEDKEKAQKTLKKLITDYPNTKISKYSRVLIEKLKSGKIVAKEATN